MICRAKLLNRLGPLLVTAAPLAAGELVTLTSGAQLRADRLEPRGAIVRLVMGGGAIEVPQAKIASVETVPDPPAPVAPPPPPAAPTPIATVARVIKSPEELLREAADRYGLPPALVRSVAKTESGIRQDAISPKGAIGVMQLMPETAARLEADPADIEQNVDAGARYLRDLLVRYEGSTHKALAAYNAGEKAVDRYNGIPPYLETQTYVRLVLGRYLKSPLQDR